MKIRDGFVSNSSSSSFVVQRRDTHVRNSPKLVTAEQEKLLKKQGFSLKTCYYPDQVDVWHPDHELTAEEKKYANWTRYVSCNQSDEIEFLLENRISFTADIHYGHSSMIYDGKTDVLIIAQNFGKQIQMWGSGKMTFASMKETKPVERTTGKQYLKKYKL